MANIYPGKIKENARDLRKNMTKQEIILWNHLRCKKILNIKFLRQKPFGQYILDFYAPEICFAIELDGSQHYGIDSKDQLRDQALCKSGVIVIRYSNNDINLNLESVLEDIYIKIQARINHVKLNCARL